MNFLSTGIKEVTRRLRRQKNRLAQVNARKAVEKAEVALGRNGWRSLGQDEGVRAEYEDLLRLDGTVEGHQAQIAEIESVVHGLESERARSWQAHEENIDRLERDRRPVQDQLHSLQDRLAERTSALPEQNEKRHALKVAQTALLKDEKHARKMLGLNEEERAARQRGLDERRAALTEQAVQLTAERSALSEPIAADHREIRDVRARLSAIDKEVQAAHNDLTERERTASLAIGERHKEIAAIRRQIARAESEKSDAYLAMGRRLSEPDAATPPDEKTADLFAVSQRQRRHYHRLIEMESQWLRESRDANRQDLRIFNFVGVTTAVLMVLGVLLVFRTPSKRDWLPSNTQTILTVDVRRFTEADFTRALQAQGPDAWQEIWSGLVRTVAQAPPIDVRRQVARITRALAPAERGSGEPVDCLLVELRPGVDADDLVRKKMVPSGGFSSRLVSGLPIYERPGLAVAQIGPATIALGSSASVQALIEVRLGLQSDLKSDAQLFSDFAQLDDNSSFRLVTHKPRELVALAEPLLRADLLADCSALGLTLDLRQPVSAVFVLDARNQRAAAGIQHLVETNPDQVLQLHSAEPNLFIERPTVSTPNDRQVEWRFRMTAPAAQEFLQRVSRLGLPGGADRKVARE